MAYQLPLFGLLVLSAAFLVAGQSLPVETDDHDESVIDLQDLLKTTSDSLTGQKSSFDGQKLSLDGLASKTEKLISFLGEWMAKSDNSTACVSPITKPRPAARDCFDLYASGHRISGVYRVRPTRWAHQDGFDVFCDMDTDGGGWTVFQSRGDFGNPQDYFFKTWKDFKEGFGDLEKEFWLGNDRLSALTTQRRFTPYELRVDMADMDYKTVFAKYSDFRVEGEGTFYKLTVAGYSGTAGDSFGYHNGMKFSTKDRDNDMSLLNCADNRQGAWWHKDCDLSNLNGQNLKGHSHGNGIRWGEFRGHRYSLFFVEMKFRPRQS